MELVTGTGDVVRVDAASDAELLRVARVGVGALGIVTEVTLQCVPAFVLHARETIEPLDDVLDGLLDHAAAVDHFELYWMPGGGKRCQVKRNVRTDEPARPQSPFGYARDKWLGENLGLAVICRVGRRFPRATPTVAKLVIERRRRARRRSIAATRCSARRGRCASSRWSTACPSSTSPTPCASCGRPRSGCRRRSCSRSRSASRPPTTSRCRPGSAGTSGWIAVHQYRGAPYEEYFELVERIMDGYGGRPHWGKLHGQRAATLAPRYPQWADFQAARDKLDPDRTFANPYLERVLG